MDGALVEGVMALLGRPVEGGAGQPTDAEWRSELELLVARALLRQGSLAETAALLSAAAERGADAGRQQAIAQQLLLLAKAWAKQAGPDAAVGADDALRRAVDLAPALAAPALAQHLQRQGRRAEAEAQWRRAIELNPQEPAHALALARLQEQDGRAADALDTYLALIDAAPTARNYLVVAARLEALSPALPEALADRRVKIALEGNATLDHLRSYLTVECYRAGLRPTFYQGGFDQYTQELLDAGSGLYAFAPDVLICAIHASRLFPRLHQYPFDLAVAERRAEAEAGLAQVQALLDAFTQRSPALVLLHNMVAPQHPALGIQDWRDELGQRALFAEINAGLARIARERYSNVYLVDEDAVQARVGKARATDSRLWLTARMGWSEAMLAALAQEHLRYLKPARALGRKCIVLDLDNTLWGGVIGEDGLGGIALGADAPGNAFVAFQRELERLWRRGILLAICSKNNEADALAVFAQHPGMLLRRDHFAAQRINWEPKAANLRAIARELNIGLDSLVFLDDNPVERAQVRAELPQVLTPDLPTDPARYREALLALDVFESLALTEEDRKRNQLYAEQRARRELEAGIAAGGSLDGYLAGLGMVVAIDAAGDLTLPRIAQLTNKTNQFNLTTRRYSEAQIRDMLAGGCRVYGARVADRFGDNGLVGVAIAAPAGDAWEIDTLLLSCRVMGRGVETALLAFLVGEARAAGMRRLIGRFLPTAKNAPVKDCYRQHGFSLVERDADGGERWELDLADAAIAAPAWLEVRSSAPALA